MAAAMVGAEPSCRYGAVAHASRSVGTSMPVNAPPRRLPLEGLSVPMLRRLAAALSVNAVPPWHWAQFCAMNTLRPAVAAAVKAPLLRSGLLANALSEAT